MTKIAVAMVAVPLLMTVAAEAETPVEATCATFLAAHSEDQALFNGLILGFVAARTGYADAMRLSFEAERVVAFTKKYCVMKPRDQVIKVIDVWSAYVAKYPYPDTGNN